MLRQILICLLFFISGCYKIPKREHHKDLPFKILGSPSSDKVWIYLCGLTAEFIPKHMDELKRLDSIGKKLNIQFLAMIPTERCSQLNNRLCWPHDTQEELLDTYQKISTATKHYSIAGYVGFSNGGFFLNRLAQYTTITKPIISIGAAGPLLHKNGPFNTINLVIGKQDQWHYDHAINLYHQSQNSHLTINLIEYDTGHHIPELVLSALIGKLTYL